MGDIFKWAAEEVQHGKNRQGSKTTQKHVFFADLGWIASILGRFTV